MLIIVKMWLKLMFLERRGNTCQNLKGLLKRKSQNLTQVLHSCHPLVYYWMSTLKPSNISDAQILAT